MTDLAAAVAAVAARLAAADVPSPEVDARWLVTAAAGLDPRRAPDRPLDAAVAARLEALVARRVAREPLQLVVGTTAFRTLTLGCAPGVFVPRPETEVLAGLAIAAARAAVAARGSALVVEPCCGTGAIALGLAVELATDRGSAAAPRSSDGPRVRVVAGDVDPAAVDLATRNRDAVLDAGDVRVDVRVDVRAGDLLDILTADEHGAVDVLVANPPYLPVADLPDLPPEVAAHDPHRALFGGDDGHEIVGSLLASAASALAPGGVVLCEIDARRGDDALARATAAGLVDARLQRDLGGAGRFLVAHRPGPEVPRG